MAEQKCQHEWISGERENVPVHISPEGTLTFEPGTYIVRKTIDFGEGNILMYCIKCHELRSIKYPEELKED